MNVESNKNEMPSVRRGYFFIKKKSKKVNSMTIFLVPVVKPLALICLPVAG